MKKYLSYVCVGFLALIFVTVSCKRSFDKLVPQASTSDSLANTLKTQKVLVLVVDGARGQSVRESLPPNITTLTQNATYSWFSLSDPLGNDASSWTDMFTGVAKEKHGVVNSTFSGSNFATYPLVFQRIKTVLPSYRITTYSFSNVFTDNLKAGTDVSQTLTSDVDVKSSVVTELSNPNAGLVVGLFGAVNAAGATYGYDSSVPQYKSAILQFDGYVGEAMAAIKARKTYSKENWLVIVTSSRGGTYAITNGDGTTFSNPLINAFTVIYNASYKVKVIDKPYTGNKYEDKFVRLYSPGDVNLTSVRAEVRGNGGAYSLAPNDIYNFGTNDFTIEVKVKKNPLANGSYNYSWPTFLSKRVNKTKKTGPGWGFSFEVTTWSFFIGNSTDASHFAAAGTPIQDGNWHTYSVVVGTSGTTRYVRTFTDGVFFKQYTIPANWLNTIDDKNAPLTLGFIPTDTTNPFDGYISDVRIFLTAVPDATIAQYSCDTYVVPTHPNINSLAGNWTCTDGSGGFFKDRSSIGNNFTILQGGAPLIPGTPLGVATTWTTINSVLCPPTASNLAIYVPSTKDVTGQLLSWLAIPPADTWKLDARVWLNQ